MTTVRVSLDLSLGTFSRIETLCRYEFRNKADYLRMLIQKDLEGRKR